MYFKKFFTLPIGLFDEIVERIALYDSYFIQKRDASQKLGFLTIQKVCSAVFLLTSVFPPPWTMMTNIAWLQQRVCMQRFCIGVSAIYRDEALRQQRPDDIDRLIDEGGVAGFLGCTGSIDCMHWEWKNCPSAWKGMFQSKDGVPIVILEAIADHSTRFWHFNFGSPGALNDINALDWSLYFTMRSMAMLPGLNSLLITTNTRWHTGCI